MHILVKYFDFHMIESCVQKKTWQGCRGGEIDEISTKNVFFVESFVWHFSLFYSNKFKCK